MWVGSPHLSWPRVRTVTESDYTTEMWFRVTVASASHNSLPFLEEAAVRLWEGTHPGLCQTL